VWSLLNHQGANKNLQIKIYKLKQDTNLSKMQQPRRSATSSGTAAKAFSYCDK
jgi:hypothetical protein